METYKGHKAYKELINEFTCQIKEIKKSPDPILLRSNELLYELEKERLETQIDVWQRGRPSVEGVFFLSRLFRSMGFEPLSFPRIVDRVSDYTEYKAIIERLGFPEKCCERTVTQLA